MNKDDTKASGKRLKISKAQQYTMLEVLGASLILGTCMVISLFLFKYIKFNTEIITQKGTAINEYDQTLRNVGICKDADKNGRLNGKELDNCNPGELSLNDVQGSLRYNVIDTMAQNEDLETVARKREEDCYDADGKKIDFYELYEKSDDDLEKQQYLQLTKICSALRVIPDALPAQRNAEALMASVNQIFILSNWEPETLSPREDAVMSPIKGVGVIPTTLRIEGSDGVTMTTLNNLEHSIRDFDVTSAVFEWTNTGISMQASANAYYLDQASELETTRTVYASKKAKETK